MFSLKFKVKKKDNENITVNVEYPTKEKYEKMTKEEKILLNALATILNENLK